MLKSRKLERYSFILPVVILLLAVTIFPLIYSLAVSLHVWDLRLNVLWDFVGLKNYGKALFGDARFWHSLWVTLRLGIPAILLQFVLGFALALLLDRSLPGTRLFNTLLVLPVMVSPMVAALIFRMIYHEKYGALNAVLSYVGLPRNTTWLADRTLSSVAIILVDTWQWTPLIMMILLAGLKSISPEQIEAARVDGAHRLQVFWHITLPLLRMSMIVALLIRFIDIIKLFDSVFILTGGGPGSTNETVSMYIYLVGFRYFRMGYASALSYLLLIFASMLSTLFIRVTRGREV
jgi:multiple sugar transport system permease protein